MTILLIVLAGTLLALKLQPWYDCSQGSARALRRLWARLTA